MNMTRTATCVRTSDGARVSDALCGPANLPDVVALCPTCALNATRGGAVLECRGRGSYIDGACRLVDALGLCVKCIVTEEVCFLQCMCAAQGHASVMINTNMINTSIYNTNSALVSIFRRMITGRHHWTFRTGMSEGYQHDILDIGRAVL
jgi:hypothetical protein